MSSANDSTRRITPDVEALDDMKERVRERAEEIVEDAREAIDNFRESLREKVSARPVTSLLVAGGIGLLVGLLIARRR